jgi:hypothetical protein
VERKLPKPVLNKPNATPTDEMYLKFEFFNSHSASIETQTYPNEDLLMPINDHPQLAHVLKIPIIIDKVILIHSH